MMAEPMSNEPAEEQADSTLTAGWGVAAGLLREQGIRVLGESRLEELLRQDVR